MDSWNVFCFVRGLTDILHVCILDFFFSFFLRHIIGPFAWTFLLSCTCQIFKGSMNHNRLRCSPKSICFQQVKEIRRAFKATDTELSYTVQMATHNTNLEPHLKAILKKIWCSFSWNMETILFFFPFLVLWIK